MLHTFSFSNNVVKHFPTSIYILTQVYKNESIRFPINGNRSTARYYEYYFALYFLMRFILRPDSFKTEILLTMECRLQIARYSTWKGARLIDSLCVCVCAPIHTTLSSCMYMYLAKPGISGRPYLKKCETNIHPFNHVHLWSPARVTQSTKLTKKLPCFWEIATYTSGSAHTCTTYTGTHQHAGIHPGF